MDFLSELEYFIYWNSEAILGVSVLIALGGLIARLAKRGPLSKKTASLIMSVCFILAGSVQFVNSYWIGLDALTSELFVIVTPISIVYVIMTSGQKKEPSQKPAARGTTGTRAPRFNLNALFNPGTASASAEMERSEPVSAEVKQRESRRIESAWDHVTFSCPTCGETLLGRSKFCYKCGAPTAVKAETILNGKAVSLEEL